MKRPDPQTDLQNLRARAERRRLAASAPLAPADAQRLAQELQVHQIELEMQYEELLGAQADAEASRAEYLDLYDFAPVGYCTLAPDGTLAQLNLCTGELLGTGRQQLVGRRLALFVAMADRPAFARFLARLWAAPGQRHACELAMRRADDAPFFAQLVGTVSPAPTGDDANGRPAGCRLALLDVTDRRRAADALAASEARFRASFEQSYDGMALLRDLRLADANAAALRLLGRADKAQVLGRPLAECWPEHQPDGQRPADALAHCARRAHEQGWCRHELRRYDAAGQAVWDELSFSPALVQGEALLHLAWRDITDRKLSEQRLRDSEERLQLALAASGTGTWAWELATQQLHQDALAQKIFELSGPSVPFGELRAAVHPDDLAAVEAALNRALADHGHFELEHRLVRPDGTVRYVAATGRFAYDEHTGQALRLAGLVRDVTATATAAAELRESEARLNLALEASETGVFSRALATGQVHWDARAQAIFGRPFDAAPVPYEVFLSSLHPGDAARMRAGAAGAVASGAPLAFDYRVVWPDGSVHHVSSAGRAVADAQGQPASFAGVVRDVTALYAAEEELRYKNRLLDHLLQNLPVVFARLGPDGRYREMTGAGLRRLGLADNELVGQRAAERFPSEAARLQRLLAGHSASYVVPLEHHGQPVYFLSYGFWDAARQEGIRFFIDITESERLKEETTGLRLRQQQEVLSAILTTQEEERRRIAEALHNGVGQLLYATRLHLDSLPASAPVRASQGILTEAIRATRTISFELTPGILEDFGLEAALRELARRIPASQLAVDLNLHHLDEPLPTPLATAVYRVVQELLNNVMKHAQAREVFVQVAREAGEVHLSVEDDGVGFDPASPAPPPGIGLAGIRTRVGLLGGTLTIQSRAGQGTGVFLVLPITTAP